MPIAPPNKNSASSAAANAVIAVDAGGSKGRRHDDRERERESGTDGGRDARMREARRAKYEAGAAREGEQSRLPSRF